MWCVRLALFALALLNEVAFAQVTDTASQAAAKQPSLIEMLAMPLGFLVIMYFFIIRPQQKKAREQADLLNNLKPGDEIITSGGIIGKVRSVADSFVNVDVSGNTTIKVLKSAITAQNKPQIAAAAGKEAQAKS